MKFLFQKYRKKRSKEELAKLFVEELKSHGVEIEYLKPGDGQYSAILGTSGKPFVIK